MGKAEKSVNFMSCRTMEDEVFNSRTTGKEVTVFKLKKGTFEIVLSIPTFRGGFGH